MNRQCYKRVNVICYNLHREDDSLCFFKIITDVHYLNNWHILNGVKEKYICEAHRLIHHAAFRM